MSTIASPPAITLKMQTPKESLHCIHRKHRRLSTLLKLFVNYWVVYLTERVCASCLQETAEPSCSSPPVKPTVQRQQIQYYDVMQIWRLPPPPHQTTLTLSSSFCNFRSESGSQIFADNSRFLSKQEVFYCSSLKLETKSTHNKMSYFVCVYTLF